MAIETVNPATGMTVKSFPALGDDEVEARIARGHATFATYRRTTFAQRAAWMCAAADLLDAEKHDIAATMTLEMGKTRRSAVAEAEKCAKGMRFYAEHAEAFLADEPLADPASVGASRAYATYQPLGVVLAAILLVIAP